eukprot:gene43369-58742_t
MRRVVVTGLGVVSSIGSDAAEVTASLRDTKSGISFSPDFAEHGFKCQVWGKPNLDPTEQVDRRAMRFLSQGGAWNHVAMKQAIADSGLEETDYAQNERVGIIMGSGGPSTKQIVEAADIVRQNKSPKRIGPFAEQAADPDRRRKQLQAFIRAGHDFALARTLVFADSMDEIA